MPTRAEPSAQVLEFLLAALQRMTLHECQKVISEMLGPSSPPAVRAAVGALVAVAVQHPAHRHRGGVLDYARSLKPGQLEKAAHMVRVVRGQRKQSELLAAVEKAYDEDPMASYPLWRWAAHVLYLGLRRAAIEFQTWEDRGRPGAIVYVELPQTAKTNETFSELLLDDDNKESLFEEEEEEEKAEAAPGPGDGSTGQCPALLSLVRRKRRTASSSPGQQERTRKTASPATAGGAAPAVKKKAPRAGKAQGILGLKLVVVEVLAPPVTPSPATPARPTPPSSPARLSSRPRHLWLRCDVVGLWGLAGPGRRRLAASQPGLSEERDSALCAAVLPVKALLRRAAAEVSSNLPRAVLCDRALRQVFLHVCVPDDVGFEPSAAVGPSSSRGASVRLAECHPRRPDLGWSAWSLAAEAGVSAVPTAAGLGSAGGPCWCSAAPAPAVVAPRRGGPPTPWCVPAACKEQYVCQVPLVALGKGEAELLADFQCTLKHASSLIGRRMFPEVAPDRVFVDAYYTRPPVPAAATKKKKKQRSPRPGAAAAEGSRGRGRLPGVDSKRDHKTSPARADEAEGKKSSRRMKRSAPDEELDDDEADDADAHRESKRRRRRSPSSLSRALSDSEHTQDEERSDADSDSGGAE